MMRTSLSLRSSSFELPRPTMRTWRAANSDTPNVSKYLVLPLLGRAHEAPKHGLSKTAEKHFVGDDRWVGLRVGV